MIGYEEVTYPKKVVIAVVAVVITILVLMIWRPGEGPRSGEGPREVEAHAGDRIAGQVGGPILDEDSGDVSSGPALAAQLPYGAVRVSWKTGRRVSDGNTLRYSTGDTRLVTVRWTPRLWVTDGAPGAWGGQGSTSAREPTSRLVLRAGGRRYVATDDLRSGNAPGSVTIAVADASALRLQVETGGRRQIATSAAVTRTAAGNGGSICGDLDDETAGGCFTATRASYVPGLGIAPTGKDWIVVTGARITPSFDRRSDGFVVEEREVKGRDDPLEYVATGKPELMLTLSGGPEPVRTRGRTSLKTTDLRLNDRAYLVPSEQEVKVTLNYRTAARLAPGQDLPAGQPRRHIVAGGTAVAFTPNRDHDPDDL